MPTVTLNKKIFEMQVGRKLPDAELKDRISMLGTDLDAVTADRIDVEIFPNRPDMLSEQGFARAFSSFIGASTGLRKYNVVDSSEKLIVDKSVAKVRPYTACAIVRNLKFDDDKIKEVIQIQEKLHVTFGRNRKKAAIGIYPCDKIKFPVYYKALKPEEIKFRPLEAPGEMSGKQILSQHPAGRAYGNLLEGYDKYPVFIDSAGEVLSMPPIINSHVTGKVSEETKEVFIECSGHDFNTLKTCLNIIVTALADMGGKIYSMKLEYQGKAYNSPDLEPKQVKISVDYVNRILGLKLKENELKKLLEKMGYGYSAGKAYVPCYRADILHPIDLVEDAAIAYGYENFKEEIPNVATVGQESGQAMLIRKISRILSGFGFLETSTYHIANKLELNDKMMVKLDAIELANALTEDYNTLRNWMIPCLMKVLSENKHNEYPQKIFETGTVFMKDPSEETGITEFKRLAVLASHATSDYTEVKQILDGLMNALGFGYEILDVDHPSFMPGRVGRVVVNGKKAGYIGEIHPGVLEKWGIENPVAALELNISELFKII